MLSIESLLGWTPEASSEAAPGHHLPELDDSARHVARRVIADTLPRLDETRRLVMALYYYEELTPNEIAQALGLPSPHVQAIRLETVKMLRREIEARIGRKSEGLA